MVDLESQTLAPKVRDLFLTARGHWAPSAYKVMYGGRGGLKSWGFARMAVLQATKRKTRFLCAREFQNSIRDSVHYTLCRQIEALKFGNYFEVQRDVIRSKKGSEFIFKGIRNNPDEIKSTEGVDICWVEEAQSVSEHSWNVLVPTIVRRPGAEIWVSFNPDLESDATSKKFLQEPPPNARIIETNWRDNPWLPPQMHAEREYLARVDPDAHAHVWEGKYRTNSDAQVLRGKCVVERFTPQVGWDGPYQGCDWGNVDPTVLIRCWISGRRLFIEYEAYKVGADLHELAGFFNHEIPRATEYVTRADNAWPQSVNYMKRVGGFPKMEGVDKWSGSVEDGVAFLRQFEQIVIDPRCIHAIEESRLWSYKTDRITGDVLPDLKDGNDHCWDATRYALQPLIKNNGRLALGTL